jgi:DNA-binding NarL/FixJ family response regulator
VIRVLVADDHSLVRAGVRTLLSREQDMILVGEAANGSEALRLCRKLRPDVLALNLCILGGATAATLTDLYTYCPTTKTLLLVSDESDFCPEEIISAIAVAGALCKDDALSTFVSAIRAVAQGNTWFDQRLVEKMVQWQQSQSTRHPKTLFTQRQLDVLRLIVAGKMNKEISEELCISTATVAKHIGNMCKLLNAHSRQELAVFAVREGLV